ncbi:MAG: hypothetical protein IJ357_04830 [Oscillospiraceae bacterium]|nr:hypothetical protein [Oscillospiraceae bacterium]
MKRLSVLLLTFLLLFSACAPLPPEPSEIETEPVSPSQEIANTPTEDEGNSWDINSGEDAPIWFDRVELMNTESLAYSGETVRLDLSYNAVGLSEEGIAVYLYLDGQLQPFRLEEDGALAWTHMLYPAEYGSSNMATLYFTPTLGQTGDRLELTLYFQAHPGYISGQAVSTDAFHGLTDLEQPRSITTQLRFEADPPAAELPEAEKSLLSWEITCEPLTGEDSTRGYPYFGFTVNGTHSTEPIVYNVKAQDTLALRCSLIGCPAAQYSLTFLLDGQPVSVDPADWMTFETEAGQDVIVEAQVNVGDFETAGKVSAILIRRDGEDRTDEGRIVFYLSAAEYYEAHVELVNPEGEEQS